MNHLSTTFELLFGIHLCPVRLGIKGLIACRLLMTLVFSALVSAASMAQTELKSRIVVSPNGIGICDDYLKLLNQTKQKEPLPVCDVPLARLPGAKPLDWEDFDVTHNLTLLHKLEWHLRGYVKPEPPPEFSDWLAQFQRRAKRPASLPRIRQAHVLIEADQAPQLVYLYESAGSSCSAEKLAAWKQGFGPFLLFDDELQNGLDGSWRRGYAFIHGNRLHFLSSYLNDKTHFWEWGASIRTFDGTKFRRNARDEYQSTFVCSFKDSEIFYPPPRR